MRITQNMLVGNFMVNLNKNFREMDKLQNQLSSGKRISKPSDDPVRVITSLRLRSGLTETAKYLENTVQARAWLETNDIALGQMGEILHKVNELVIQGATDAVPQESRDAIAKEIEQLKQQLTQIANTTHDGRYIFAGFQTTEPPFTDAGVYSGDDSPAEIQYEIGVGITLSVNITGERVFGPAAGLGGEADLFVLMDSIVADLYNGDVAALSNQKVNDLKAHADNILALRAEAGSKINRLEMTQSRLQDAELNLGALLSENENIDYAETITQLKMQENTYRTALAAGARIIQPSLLDFLR